jgi:kinetochore protein Mis12/MTW1
VVTAEDVPSPEAVELQRTKLHETAKLNIVLKAKEAKNAVILQQLSALIGAEPKQDGDSSHAPFAFLHAAPGQSKHLEQDTQNALGQIPAVQQLLTQLKEAMQTIIPTAKNARYNDEDSAEGRRRRYLENQSRRALERKGIDLDSSAGTSLAAGRKMGRDEIEGIESVVQALGGAEASKKARD